MLLRFFMESDQKFLFKEFITDKSPKLLIV